MTVFFENTVAGLASIANAEAGDVAIVLLNTVKYYEYVGSPLTWSRLDTIVIPHGTTFVSNRIFDVLTADPPSPADDTAWIKRTAGSPDVVSLCVRIASVTYEAPIVSIS